MKRITLIIIAILLFFSCSSSQNITRPKIAGPNGLWVNSYNGVLFFGQTDMETQNTAMPMQLRFYYNSSSNDIDYGYGLGFSLGYEMRYEVGENGNILIVTGNGRSDMYTRYGDEFVSPAGVFSTLSFAENKYILKEKNGDKYEFADPYLKKLTSQIDRNGNRTTLTYSTDSMLTRIQDAVGHTITLEYANKLLVRSKATFHIGSITYSYDSKRRLVGRTDAMGNTIHYGYDKENRIDEITDANGQKINIFYNSSGMVSRLKSEVSDKSIRYDGNKTVFIDYAEPENIYSYYRWDEKGRAIEKAGQCCGIQATLVYDEEDNVIKRTDANGNNTTYTYDNRSNMLSLTDPNGFVEKCTYDATFNQVTSYTDKNGNKYSYSYDVKGNLTAISGPLGFGSSYTYDDHGWLVTSTDANGNVTRISYNSDGTIGKVLDAAGYTTSYNYDICGNIISITDGRGNVTTYNYDKNNRLLAQIDALGHKTNFSYDKVGNVVRIKNAMNQIYAFSYDALGNIVKEVDSQGGTYIYTYDGRGNVVSRRDPIGNVQTFTWNERNKILSQTNEEDETTSYDYDAKGNLIKVYQPNGNVITFKYDASDRLEQLSDIIGLVARYTYDCNGNRLTETDGLEHTTTYTYDARNRCISEMLPSGSITSFVYDNNSNLIMVTDAKGYSTNYAYNSLDQQISQTDALNARTMLEYDGNGNIVKVIDAKGNATTYTYDAINQNTTISFANNLSLQYTYDKLGHVVACQDRAGQVIRYSYNVLGNLITKTYPDGTTDIFSYDGINRMISATNKDAIVNFTYDRSGRLLTESLNGKISRYEYDVATGKRSMIYPSGTKVVEQLNSRDLITSIFQNGDEVVTIDYNVAGQKISQSFANGITTTYGYSENGWLNVIKDNLDVLNLEMNYDANGNIIQVRDMLNNNNTESYDYDAVGQLISFKRGSSVDKSYIFDLVGNRIRVLENGISTNYTSNNVNAYTTIIGGLSFTPQYDDNGNMINDGHHNYTYDYNNKLISVDESIGIYKYDAFGRRIAKNSSFYYYAGDQMVEEFSNNAFTSYLYGNAIDEALQMKRNKDVFYYHTNHLGSVLALSNLDGKDIEHIEYDVYGIPVFYDVEGNSGPKSFVGNSILFSGREFNEETSTYYFRLRNQNPLIGRFMQKDPLMYIDGMNDYVYVNNRSTMELDVYGLSIDHIFGRSNYDCIHTKLNPNRGINKVPEVSKILIFNGVDHSTSAEAQAISNARNLNMARLYSKYGPKLLKALIKKPKVVMKMFGKKIVGGLLPEAAIVLLINSMAAPSIAAENQESYWKTFQDLNNAYIDMEYIYPFQDIFQDDIEELPCQTCPNPCDGM